MHDWYKPSSLKRVFGIEKKSLQLTTNPDQSTDEHMLNIVNETMIDYKRYKLLTASNLID